MGRGTFKRNSEGPLGGEQTHAHRITGSRGHQHSGWPRRVQLNNTPSCFKTSGFRVFVFLFFRAGRLQQTWPWLKPADTSDPGALHPRYAAYPDPNDPFHGAHTHPGPDPRYPAASPRSPSQPPLQTAPPTLSLPCLTRHAVRRRPRLHGRPRHAVRLLLLLLGRRRQRRPRPHHRAGPGAGRHGPWRHGVLRHGAWRHAGRWRRVPGHSGRRGPRHARRHCVGSHRPRRHAWRHVPRRHRPRRHVAGRHGPWSHARLHGARRHSRSHRAWGHRVAARGHRVRARRHAHRHARLHVHLARWTRLHLAFAVRFRL